MTVYLVTYETNDVLGTREVIGIYANKRAADSAITIDRQLRHQGALVWAYETTSHELED